MVQDHSDGTIFQRTGREAWCALITPYRTAAPCSDLSLEQTSASDEPASPSTFNFVLYTGGTRHGSSRQRISLFLLLAGSSLLHSAISPRLPLRGGQLKSPLPTARSRIEAHTMSSSRQFGLPSTSSAHRQGSDQPPPAYTEYPTELPTTFPIGKHEVPPLVNVTDLQAHLRLLGAFDRLKYTVEHPDDGLPARMQREHLWILFLNRAVQRFEAFMSATWPNNVVVASTEATMPPLDVLMVWHTYLLV